MKKLFGFIGVGLLAGVVTYIVINKIGKDNNNREMRQNEAADNNLSDKGSAMVNSDNICNAKSDFDRVKYSTISTMAARHEEAAKVMKDAVDLICEQSTASEKEDIELDNIAEELNELLSEE